VIENNLLLFTAASIGFVHTLLGTDHYLPFIILSKSRAWSFQKTIFITFLCGIGHVLGSVFLGLAGIIFGAALGRLEAIESLRGGIASWLLIAFGVAYSAWGVRLLLRAKKHVHGHEHGVENHKHVHDHLGKHTHIHGNAASVTPWALFIIFILGPCEPLIPVLMYPAVQNNWQALFAVTFVFAFVTVGTMLAIVAGSYKGLRKIKLGYLEKYAHVLSGLIIALSGIIMLLLGL